MGTTAQTDRRKQRLLDKIGDFTDDCFGVEELIVVYKRTGEWFIDFEGPTVTHDERVAPAALHEAAHELEHEAQRPGDWLDKYIAEQRDQAAIIFSDPTICDYTEARRSRER